MKVLLFGSSGYIGSKLVMHLRNLGIKVVGADQQPSETTDELVDIRFFEQTSNIIHREKPDIIVNMAYLLAGGTAKNPHNALHLNVMGVNNIFEAATWYNVSRVVYSSSIAVYGTQKDYGENEVNEETHGKPATLYGWMKQLNEACARHYAATTNTEFVGIRISSVYGSDRIGGKFNPVGFIIFAPKDNTPIRIPIPSHHEACFIHVNDVVKIFSSIILADRLNHDMYNTGGETLTLKELTQLASQIYKRPIYCDEDGEDFPHVSRVNSDRLDSEFNITRLGLLEFLNNEYNTNLS